MVNHVGFAKYVNTNTDRKLGVRTSDMPTLTLLKAQILKNVRVWRNTRTSFMCR